MTSCPKVVFLLGPPGAGKGTQSIILKEKHQFIHLSAGDLLRGEMANNGPNAELISNIIRDGKLVPAEITIELLKRAMEEQPGKSFIIDGFPRSIVQAELYAKIVGNLGICTINLDVQSESVLIERLLKRAETSGRSDDNIDSIRKRFSTFRNETFPVFEYLNQHGNYIIVDGDDTIEKVAENMMEALQPFSLL
eukprot:TRINITY_DN144_c0_g1_i1.p1 TRINITY_DN144_c0_g1~~TRINITY_DN144_c0_g1_i1.p1  ORF type:complete len:194 (+),score=64.51 TRINITY_DN144_c0_g1_i1:34-615(+)